MRAGQSAETQALFSNPDVTLAELDAAVQTAAAGEGTGGMGGYGLSKCALTAFTMVQAKMYPNLVCTSLSPGFIDTNMTRVAPPCFLVACPSLAALTPGGVPQGFGASLTPEQGCVSLIKCLFGDVTSGWYYGSDGLRSPLTVTRDPGTPEYQGEADPDAAVYNS